MTRTERIAQQQEDAEWSRLVAKRRSEILLSDRLSYEEWRAATAPRIPATGGRPLNDLELDLLLAHVAEEGARRDALTLRHPTLLARLMIFRREVRKIIARAVVGESASNALVNVMGQV